MGLDLAFSKSLALAAGAKLTTSREGTDEQIKAAEADTPQDSSYLAYLKSINEYFMFPGYEYSIWNTGDDQEIVVRANKWGSLYKPLTEWLTKNNITWSEF